MKSAEEWHEVAKQIAEVLSKPDSGIINHEFVQLEQAIKLFKAIQLDAYKAGMKHAAQQIYKDPTVDEWIPKAILTEAEQLKEMSK